MKLDTDDNPNSYAPIELTSPRNTLEMSDSDPKEKKSGIPSWQQNAAQKPLQEDDKPKSEPESNAAAKLEQARKFLEDDEVKDAPTDKKIEFLESKGVRNEDIQSLLGVSKNQESSNTPPSPPSNTQVPPLLPSLSTQILTTSRPPHHHLPNPPQPHLHPPDNKPQIHLNNPP